MAQAISIKSGRLRLEVSEDRQELSISYDLGGNDSINIEMKRAHGGWAVAVGTQVEKLTHSESLSVRGVVLAIVLTLDELVGPYYATGDYEGMAAALKRCMDKMHDYLVNECFA